MFLGCEGRQSALNPAAIQASHIESQWWLMFWICLVAYVGVLICIGRATSRAEHESGPAAIPPILTQHNTPRLKLIVGIALVITIAALFVMLCASILTGNAIAKLTTRNPMTVEVIGHQWWWEIKYDNTAPNLSVTTANEMHLPLGKEVLIKTSTRDVIHSFWVPNLTGKRDLIPGYENQVVIRPTREGIYRGQCAEFCGFQHAHMALDVVIEPPARFESWLAGQRADAVIATDPAVRHGQQIFETHPCAMCHRIAGSEADATVGPDLTHLQSRMSLGAGTLSNNRGNLAGWILDPQAIKPGNQMPPNLLDPGDFNDLLAYLETLK